MSIAPPTLPTLPTASLLVQSDPKVLQTSQGSQVAFRNSVFLQLPITPAGQPLPPADTLTPWLDGVGKLSTQLLMASQWPKTQAGLPVTSAKLAQPASQLPVASQGQPQPWQYQA